jgi:aryl-alcohol dehydrogenase-like predicted oxidoreductase
MQAKKLGRSGLKVSQLCLGTMGFGWSADEPTSFLVMDSYLEAGGNFIDTADVYSSWVPEVGSGVAESIVGKWMKERGNRDGVILATKVRGRMWDGPSGEGLSRIHIIRACEDSLRRLQTDTVDLYQCHWADLETPIEETLRALQDLITQGKVRYIGASNFPAWRLMEAHHFAEKYGLEKFVSYQPGYSLMERALFEYEAMPFCKHYGLGVIPYSPLAGGFLSGKYRKDQPVPDSVRAKGISQKYFNERGWGILATVEKIASAHGKNIPQTALAWMLANPVVTSPIIGANSVEQLQEIIDVEDYRLTEDELKELNEVSMFTKDWRPIWD